MNAQTNRPIIISIEGNIGVGKSTILEQLRKCFSERGILAAFMPEPVSIWDTIRDENGATILSKYYENANKYSFPFQVMAYSTRLSMLRRTIAENPECNVIVCERSLEADKNIFAKMLFDDKQIEHVNYQIYNLLYNDTAQDYKVDGVLYMRASPSKCKERIQIRQRDGESNIPLEYLEKCDHYYQTWLDSDNDTEFPIYKMNNEEDVEYDEYNMTANRWLEEALTFINKCSVEKGKYETSLLAMA